MSDEIDDWISRLRHDDSQAKEMIWNHHLDRLLRFASRRIGNTPMRDFDENDIVQSAFASFFRGVAKDRFPQLEHEADVWRLLVVITARRIVRRQRMMMAQRRGEGQAAGESALGADEDAGRGIEQIFSKDPSPEVLAELSDTLRHLLTALDDDSLRGIVLARAEGLALREIAERMECSERTIKRKLALIREIWLAQNDTAPFTHDAD